MGVCGFWGSPASPHPPLAAARRGVPHRSGGFGGGSGRCSLGAAGAGEGPPGGAAALAARGGRSVSLEAAPGAQLGKTPGRAGDAQGPLRTMMLHLLSLLPSLDRSEGRPMPPAGPAGSGWTCGALEDFRGALRAVIPHFPPPPPLSAARTPLIILRPLRQKHRAARHSRSSASPRERRRPGQEVNKECHRCPPPAPAGRRAGWGRGVTLSNARSPFGG